MALLSVTNVDGGSVVLAFSGPVELDADPGPPPDFAFHIGEQPPASVAPSGAAEVLAAFPGGIGPGDPWALDAQPNWLTTPVTTPASGAVE